MVFEIYISVELGRSVSLELRDLVGASFYLGWTLESKTILLLAFVVAEDLALIAFGPFGVGSDCVGVEASIDVESNCRVEVSGLLSFWYSDGKDLVFLVVVDYALEVTLLDLLAFLSGLFEILLELRSSIDNFRSFE